MKPIVKVLLITWMIYCAVFSWVALAAVNMFLTLANAHILAAFTPLIGATIVFCIIRYVIQIYRDEVSFGKKTVQQQENS